MVRSDTIISENNITTHFFKALATVNGWLLNLHSDNPIALCGCSFTDAPGPQCSAGSMLSNCILTPAAADHHAALLCAVELAMP
jgi:hypothetical protein